MQICPKCFDEISPDRSDCCELIEIRDILTAHPAVSMVLTGYTNNGKTVLLESIISQLKKLEGALSGFSVNHLDADTKHFLRSRPGESIPLPSDGVTKILLNAYGMPVPGRSTYERRLLFFYDTEGEVYDHDSVDAVTQKPLLTSNVIWLIHDPTNPEPPGLINEAFQSIVREHRVNQAPLAGKKVIVVYTQADKFATMASQLDGIDMINRYLTVDPMFGPTALQSNGRLNNMIDLQAYMSEAQRMSDVLRSVTKMIDGGQNLLDQAKENDVELRFCLVESVGQVVDDGIQRGDRMPKRVLDPLFWSLFQETPGDPVQPTIRHGRVKLIADGRQKKLFENRWPAKIWNALKKSHFVDFYFLGRNQAESDHPSPPPEESYGDQYPGLIGPILESSEPYDQFVLLCDEKLPLDITDFEENEEIEGKLQVVITNPKLRDQFVNTMLVRSDDDLQALANRVQSNRH